MIKIRETLIKRNLIITVQKPPTGGRRRPPRLVTITTDYYRPEPDEQRPSRYDSCLFKGSDNFGCVQSGYHICRDCAMPLGKPLIVSNLIQGTHNQDQERRHPPTRTAPSPACTPPPASQATPLRGLPYASPGQTSYTPAYEAPHRRRGKSSQTWPQQTRSGGYT